MSGNCTKYKWEPKSLGIGYIFNIEFENTAALEQNVEINNKIINHEPR